MIKYFIRFYTSFQYVMKNTNLLLSTNNYLFLKAWNYNWRNVLIWLKLWTKYFPKYLYKLYLLLQHVMNNIHLLCNKNLILFENIKHQYLCNRNSNQINHLSVSLEKGWYSSDLTKAWGGGIWHSFGPRKLKFWLDTWNVS